MTIISTTVGENVFKKNEAILIVNKTIQNVELGCNLKNDRMISIHFQGKPFNNTVIQVYTPNTNAKEAERFSEDLQDPLELTSKESCPFHHRGLECKRRSK